MKNSIILVGFMASGKTTIGKCLADRLNFNFIDIDMEIEKLECMSINDIFLIKGESYFRTLESSVLDFYSGNDRTVIATGGGVVLSKENREKLHAIDKVIYLYATPEWVLTNLKRSTTVRPLLVAEIDPMSKIIELMQLRSEYYNFASRIRIDVDSKSPEQIVDDIIINI